MKGSDRVSELAFVRESLYGDDVESERFGNSPVFGEKGSSSRCTNDEKGSRGGKVVDQLPLDGVNVDLRSCTPDGDTKLGDENRFSLRSGTPNGVMSPDIGQVKEVLVTHPTCLRSHPIAPLQSCSFSVGSVCGSCGSSALGCVPCSCVCGRGAEGSCSGEARGIGITE